MNRKSPITQLLWALLAGIILAWVTNVIEGFARAQHLDTRDSGDWLHAFLLYGWFGLATGLLWGCALLLLDALRAPRRPLFGILLVPGLLFVSAFLVGGYWLNDSRFMPPFWTLQGKLWTLVFGVGILIVCAVLAFIISRIKAQKRPTGRAPAVATVVFALGLVTVLVPPAYHLVTRETPSTLKRADTSEGPPVIVILVDTLRRDHLQSYGYPKPTSPRLEEFSKDALLFLESTTTGNMTIPSVATLFTGMYPSEHEVIWAIRDLPEDSRTIGETFHQAGYRTGAFVGNPVVRPELGFGRGFDFFYPTPPPRWIHDRKTALELLSIRLTHEGTATHGSQLVDQTLRWLAEPSHRPPFVYLHTFEPHSPYDPGGRHADPFLPPNTMKLPKYPPMIWDYKGDDRWASFEDTERRPQVSEHDRQIMVGLYDGEIHLTDHLMGRLFDGLREIGLFDEAIIVFLSDHGEEFDEHGGWFHGLTVYEEMTGMPLLVKLPRNSGGGLRTDLSVDMVDVLPTLCGLVRSEAPEKCTGEDHSKRILEIAAGGNPSRIPTNFVERPPHLYALRMGRWKILQRTVFDKTTHRLYDLIADPGESENAAYTYPDTMAMMRTLLGDLIRRVTPSGGLAVDVEREKLDPETERVLKSLGYIK
jgi:arylsulfatase A-like enzyme